MISLHWKMLMRALTNRQSMARSKKDTETLLAAGVDDCVVGVEEDEGLFVWPLGGGIER